ncbi:MAG: hypothetical protein BGP16_06265 [Sphingobium sp. 66-54]|nr:MAG: hypothetical protein BGP16_06265 [Sphingobium sp. 66-54]
MAFWWIGLGIVFPLAWLANNWVRARHGYPLEDGAGGVTYREDPETNRKIALLSDENGRLRDQIGRLEERIAVLERIATDPADRTARAIEALR